MIVELLLSCSLILPGFWILHVTKIEVSNIIERVVLSYIFSLTLMFSILYIGSILKLFNVASFLFLAIIIFSISHFILFFARKNWRKISTAYFSQISNISKEKLVIIISATGLLLIYAICLLSSAILDSDVVQYYLPIAREIVKANEFAYGYDYNILLKPIGSSVLYAWTYIINGSIFSESFRLMPLVPMFLLIVLNYAIATSATNSKTIGIISSAIFLVLPFHDRQLFFNAFYPDIFYYPLIFAAMYFILKYSQSKRDSLLVWTGIGLGVASLLKAQTIFVLIAFAVVLLALELRNHKKLSVALCCLAPFYILVPNIVANTIQGGTFHLSLPVFTGSQWILFLFLSAISGACCYVTIQKSCSETKINWSIIKDLVKKICLLLIPVVLFSSLWYLHNLLRFDTLIWTSSINLPNYDWALGVLQPLETIQQTVGVGYFVSYFIFMFVDPAVMGYIMLVPFLIGLVLVFGRGMESFGGLFLFSVIFASVILSNVVFSLHSASGYNPRDIFVFAPLLTTISAVGIVSVTSSFNKARRNVKRVALSFLLAAYFGLLSYIHSVLIWFTSARGGTITGNFVKSLGNVVGLNLPQTSFQLSYADRVVFVGDNILKIISLSLIAGIPVLLFIIWRYHKLFMKHNFSGSVRFKSPRSKLIAKNVFIILVFLSVLIIPRIEVLNAQGGIQGIKEFQLQNAYRDFYEPFIKGEPKLEGNILTFKSPSGLQYYLPENKIIDLGFPANLAFLKDTLLSDAPHETVAKLRQQGINYLLFNPSITQELDTSLNFTLSKLMQNPELSLLSQKIGNWKLYTIGSYSVEKTFVPLSGWTVDERYTNASFNLKSTESEIALHLEATDINSRITIHHQDAPKLHLSDYKYIMVNTEGSNNARVLIRFFLDDGNSFDFSHWTDLYTINNAAFDLSPHSQRELRGDIYIGLISSDGTPSAFNILQVAFVNVKLQPNS